MFKEFENFELYFVKHFFFSNYPLWKEYFVRAQQEGKPQSKSIDAGEYGFFKRNGLLKGIDTYKNILKITEDKNISLDFIKRSVFH